MLDNMEVAILSKVNELAGRYGYKPYEFVATYQSLDVDDGKHEYRLRYESGPLDGKQFDKMLDSLGLHGENTALIGSDEMIYDALEAAIAKAPRPRGRA